MSNKEIEITNEIPVTSEIEYRATQDVTMAENWESKEHADSKNEGGKDHNHPLFNTNNDQLSENLQNFNSIQQKMTTPYNGDFSSGS